MSKFRKKGGKGQPAISTAALPDIVFMLLFFFMVTTTMRETTLKVKVEELVLSILFLRRTPALAGENQKEFPARQSGTPLCLKWLRLIPMKTIARFWSETMWM